MSYEIDIQTKKKGVEQTSLWEEILRRISRSVSSVPSSEVNDAAMDTWCKEIAISLGLAYYRNDNWLCFCDKDLAPN